MKTYLIEPAQREKLVRDLIVKLAVTFGSIFVVVILIAAFFVSQMPGMSNTNNVLLMAAAIAALAFLIGFRMLGQVRDYQHGLQSLHIDLGEDRISRRQWRLPDLTISRNDIILMQETDAGILVVAKDRTQYLWAPAQLEGYDEVRARLSHWMAIHKAPPRHGANTGLLTAAWGLGTALCLGVLFFTTDPWQAAAAGLATLAIYLFIYRLLRSQRGIDRRFQRTYSGVFIFLVVVVVAKLLMTLSPLITNR